MTHINDSGEGNDASKITSEIDVDARPVGQPAWFANNSLGRRQLLIAGGGAALAGLLAACGSNASSGEGTEQSSSGDGSAATAGTVDSGSATATATAGGGGGGTAGTIQQWYHQYGEEGTQAAVERYAAAYPDATVEVQWIPGEYDTTTPAALLTDDGPDVFEFGNGPTLDMIQSGQVVDMTDLFGDTLSDFNPALIERITWDDKIWAIPQVMDMQCLLYRKSMLDDAGITPPATIDDLIAAAKTLTSGDVKGLYLGEDGGAGLMGAPMIWASGQTFINSDNTLGFSAEPTAAAFAKLREIWEADVLLLGTSEDWWSATPFATGQCAMQFTGLWTFPDVIEALGDDFGALPWPSLPNGAQSVPIGAYGSCVSAKATDVEASKAFSKWLWVDQTEYQIDFATAYGYHVPARASLSPDATPLKSGPAADAAKYAADLGRVQGHMLWTPACATAFTDALNHIVRDGADPLAEVQALIKVANDEIARVLG